MKTKMLITVLLVVIVLVSCSPVTTPILIKTTVPTSTFASVLPTALPTPASAPGSAHAQEYQLWQADQDFQVGGNWGFMLHKGEKAFLDQHDKVLEIQDAQGRVKLENLGDYRFRFYAWEDGYDVIVGMGSLLLRAGNSYTFEWPAEQGNPVQVEVRLILNDQLLGYALLIRNFNSDGAFIGYEEPITFVDSNGDGLVSIQELDTALAGLRAGIPVIAESQPALAARFDADIASAYAATHSGAVADAYQKIKAIEVEVANAVQAAGDQAAKTKAAKDQETVVYLSIAISAVILFLIAFLLDRRRRSKMSMQYVNTTPGIPEKVVKKPKWAESQEGDLERTRETPEKTQTPKTKQVVNPAPEIICSNCGNVGLPKDKFCRKCGNPLK